METNQLEGLTCWHATGDQLICGEYAGEGEPDAIITVELCENPHKLAVQIAELLNALPNVDDPVLWVHEMREQWIRASPAAMLAARHASGRTDGDG